MLRLAINRILLAMWGGIYEFSDARLASYLHHAAVATPKTKEMQITRERERESKSESESESVALKTNNISQGAS